MHNGSQRENIRNVAFLSIFICCDEKREKEMCSLLESTENNGIVNMLK